MTLRSRRAAVGSLDPVPPAAPSGALGATERATLLGMFVFLFAVALGASAGLLNGFQTLSAPLANHAPPNLSVAVWILIAFVLCLIATLVVIKVLRGTRSQAGMPFGGGVSLLSLILTCLIVIGYMALAAHLPGLSYSGSVNGTNGTGGTSPPPHGNNTTGIPPNGTVGTHGPGVPTPPIPPIVVPLATGIILAIVLVPLSAFLLRRWRREEEVSIGPSQELIDKLDEALRAFRRSSMSEARALIIEAYAILLKNLAARRVPDLDQATPREIDALLVSSLGLSTQAAPALRALFEEARYSPHEMTEAQGIRARESLDAVVQELRAHDPSPQGPRTEGAEAPA